MKKKALLSLLAALAAGSILLCSGCTVDLTSINEEDTTLSAEIESDNLSDGNLQVHSVWYQNGGDKLTSATITFSSEDGEVYSGVTDDSGKLDASTLPGNTVLTCEITDSTGEVIASSDIIFKISSDYTALTIYTPSEDENECILEIPTDKTDIRAAIFLTENGQLSFANLTPWSDSYDEETVDDGDDASAEDEDASSDESSEGEDASAEDGTDTDDASEETTDESADDNADTADDTTADSTTDETDDTAAE
ncbi:MAG: DNA polymerase V family protein [Clostridiales bacterium]|nr:DNA polymerase V family protein [Clostridiales bacterium]